MSFATKEELLAVGILDCPDVKEKLSVNRKKQKDSKDERDE